MKIHDPKLTGSIEFQSPVIGGLTASLQGTASWATNVVNGGSGGAPGGSDTQIQYRQDATTFGGVPTLTYDGSLLRGSGSFTGSFTGGFTGTASYATRADYVDGIIASALITTGSQNTTQTISGSLIIQQDLTIRGTSSIQNVTASQLNISTNTITVNTQNPSFRFGGLAAIDSGSTPQQSGSMLYDSVQDEWVFVHRGSSTSAITSSHVMMGPETYNALGDEIYIPATKLVKSVGNEHLTGSNVHDDGTTVIINSPTQITGSLVISASSNVNEFTVLGQAVITGSLIVSGSGGAGVFSKGITLADLTNGFNVTGSYYVWRAPYPATVVNLWAIKSGSSNISVNARRSGSATNHAASNLTVTTNNLWSSAATTGDTSYSAGDSLEIVFSGSSVFQSSVQVDFIKR